MRRDLGTQFGIAQQRSTLEKQLSDPSRYAGRATLDDPVQQVDAAVIAGLVLGSPEFQRR